MALIVSVTIDGSAIIAVASVALMMVGIFMTAMLKVALFMAPCSRSMSHFLFCGLLVLGNLLKNTRRLVGCLTLLKESNHLVRLLVT